MSGPEYTPGHSPQEFPMRRARGRDLRVVVAMLGARRRYLVPRVLERLGMLEVFFTDLVRPPAGRRSGEAGAAGGDGVPSGTREFRWLGLLRVVLRRWARGPDRRQGLILWANRAFARRVAAADWGAGNAVYGFNSACREILERAHREGCLCLVDQIMVPWTVEQEILGRERESWPGWETAPQRDYWRRLAEREREEWRLADRIICGSEFVARSVAADGGPGGRCVVVPYAAGQVLPTVERRDRRGPLRVLFVGTIELRKGIQYLMDAVRMLGRGRVEVRAVGPVQVSRAAARRLAEWMRLEGPQPRGAVEGYYRWADVFVLPSLAEGSANACFEALGAGLPVITTPNAGSVVRDGREGFVVPVRDAAAIAEKLERLAESAGEREYLGANARQRALEFSEEKYAGRLVAVLAEVAGGGTGGGS